jgi:hypothetical protein
MATSRQNNDFVCNLFSSDLLDTAIDWIGSNLAPGDVFEKVDIAHYTQANIEINCVYSERNILDFVKSTYGPEDVFDRRDLEAWAEENGYAKVTEE